MPPAPVVQGVAFAPEPRVTDPQPAPGAIVPAGPAVIAARVHDAGDDDVTLLVDGEPAQGLPVDPDGGLSSLAGVEVVLTPGVHTLAVVVDDVVVRGWQVAASSLEVLDAEEDDEGLATRLRPAPRDARVAVLIDPTRPDLAIAAAPIAALLDAVVLPTGRFEVPTTTWAALSAMAVEGAPGPAEVVLLGDIAAISPAVESALTTAGMPTARLGAPTAAGLAAAGAADAASRRPDGTRALVVGPAEPFDDALAAGLAAARLDASFVLAGATVDPATAAVIGQHEVVVLSPQLDAEVRAAVVDLLSPTAVVSDDDLDQPAALDAVVVPEGTAPARTLAAGLAAVGGRAVLLGADAATAWVARHTPDRVTLVSAEAAGTAEASAATEDPGAATVTGPPSAGPLNPLRPAVPAVPAAPAAVDPLAPARPRPLTLVGSDGSDGLDPNAPALPTTAMPPTDQATPLPDPSALGTALRRAWVDGADAPQVGAVLNPTADLRVTVSAEGPVEAATVHVTVLGYEWPGQVSIDGPDVTWTAGPRSVLPLPLEPPRPDTPTPVEVTVDLTAGGRGRHARFLAQVPLSPLATTSPEGWTVAGGSTGVTGETGRLYTYSVEVEPVTGLDVAAVEAEVTAILTDARSWTADGSLRFQRVGSHRARLRVVVATPATVDRLCGDVGLRTGGSVSCWDGYRAMLNLDRWTVGVPHFGGDLVTYRQYLVNHEVGHGLGHGHVGCPRPGMLAPVMMQQTGGVGACQPNGWPFP